MSKNFWLVPTVFVLVSCCFSASAEENTDGLAEKAKLASTSSKTDCSEAWSLLWPLAKKGDIEARASLLFLMASPPDMHFIYPPGSSGDLVSRMRDITIMAAHSDPYRHKWPKEYKDAIYGFYIHSGFDKSAAGKTFLECINSNQSKDCSEIAVKKQLVPSFESYARQIDAFLDAGMKSQCVKNSMEK